MTREEIEKAIKNDEIVWYSGFDKAVKIDFSKKNKYDLREFSIFDDNDKITVLIINYTFHYSLKYLFKTKAEAEHYLHHANITRTEILPFLTWEEFDKGYTRINFKSKNGDCCSLEGYFDKDTNYGFIDVVRNWHCVFSKDYTEANFYKAYDECVRLFKGGEKE